MGKKNKKREIDYFNMSPEEQMANADLFHDVEQGERSFLDALNYKVPKAPIAQSDYKKQIERACLGIVEKDEEDEYYSTISDAITNTDETTDTDTSEVPDGYIIYSSIIDESIHAETEDDIDDNDDEDDDDIDEYAEEETSSVEVEAPIYENSVVGVKRPVDNIPRISFAYNYIVGKMLIDDGLITTPISVCHTSSIELNDENIPTDSDGYAAILSKIFYYIISCKHPAVIMSEDTFEIEFSLFSKIDFDKFIFFKNNGMVYAYVLDEGEADNFYSVVDVFNMDDNDTLRYVIESAFVSNSMHNAFMYNDEDEVESVMEARHSVKELISLIERDPKTEYAGHNTSGDILSRMRVTDLQTFVSDTSSILDDLIASDDEICYDDDEYDIQDTCDEDDNSDDVDINDFPDMNYGPSSSNIDELLDEIDDDDDDSDELPMSSNIDVLETRDEDDSMVLPVIHRRQ